MKINVKHFAAQGMVLDFLHQREALGAGIGLDGQIHEQIFRDGMMQQIRELPGIQFQVLRLGLAAINRRGHAATGAEFLHRSVLHLRTRICFQCY